MNNNDLRLTILGCFRYSFGRMTYMVSHTVQVIKDNAAIFNKGDWLRFVSEIDESPNLGMDCDKENWNDLKRLAKAHLYDFEEKKSKILFNCTGECRSEK